MAIPTVQHCDLFQRKSHLILKTASIVFDLPLKSLNHLLKMRLNHVEGALEYRRGLLVDRQRLPGVGLDVQTRRFDLLLGRDR